MLHGSFRATGRGLCYDYDSNEALLSILNSATGRTLATFNLDHFLTKKPKDYVGFLEKASQVNALMLSNNSTINLADTVSESHLMSLLESVVGISRNAYDLNALDFCRFSRIFSKEYNLKSVKIKKFVSRNKENEFYIARLHTHHGNGVCVRGCTLTGIMAGLSDRTIRDLITMEFGHRFESSAHDLLNASTRLSSLSYILDQNFIPEHKITNESSNMTIKNPLTQKNTQ